MLVQPQPVMRGSKVARFLFQQCRPQRGTPSANITHRSLAGGNYVVTDYESLLDVLVADSRDAAVRNYLIENRTPVHPMIMDLDFAFSAEITRDGWTVLLESLQSVMAELWPPSSSGVDISMFVCFAPSELVEQKQLSMGSGKMQVFNSFVKSGCHIYWPHVLVDQRCALLLRQAFIMRITERTGRAQPVDDDGREWPPWETVVDESVLVANGLRMLRSHKAGACKDCAPQRRGRGNHSQSGLGAVVCKTCASTGYLDYGRPYTPEFVLNAACERDEQLTQRFRTDMRFAFGITTVRSSLIEMPVQPHIPEWLRGAHIGSNVRTGDANAGGAKKRTREQVYNYSANGGASAGDESECVNAGGGCKRTIGGICQMFEPLEDRAKHHDAHVKAIEQFINRDTSLAGPEVQYVRRLLRAKSGDYYLAVGTNKYCNNVRRTHHNQDVYYVISRRHLWQCCWSRREHASDMNMRADCRRYSSPRVKLSAALSEQLFDPHMELSSIMSHGLWRRHDIVARAYLPKYEEQTLRRYLMARALVPLLFNSKQIDRDSPLYQMFASVERHTRPYTLVLGLPPVLDD